MAYQIQTCWHCDQRVGEPTQSVEGNGLESQFSLGGSGLDPKRPRGPCIVKELHAEIVEEKRARKVRTVSLRG